MEIFCNKYNKSCTSAVRDGECRQFGASTNGCLENLRYGITIKGNKIEDRTLKEMKQDTVSVNCKNSMNNRTINILGSEWVIKEQSINENELLKNCDGYSDWTVREIIVEREDYGTLKNTQKYINKVLRHEIVHAFLFESGLAECSGEVESWAKNETMVDWIAKQGQKIYKAWADAGCLDND